MATRRAYVASKFALSAAGLEPVRHMQALLRDAGFEITFDWTPAAEAEGVREDAPAAPSSLRSEEAQRKFLEDGAVRCVQGVQDADVVVVLLYDATYAHRGTFTELGVALGAGKRVVVAMTDAVACGLFESQCASSNCFVWLPSVTRVTAPTPAAASAAALAAVLTPVDTE